MKFLVVGLGSMGRRRIRCLRQLGVSDFVGFDKRADRRDAARTQLGITCVDDEANIDWAEFQACIVSTPPDQHAQYARAALMNNVHVFIEASVLEGEVRKLLPVERGSSAICAPSCTMMFHASIIELEFVIKSGRIGDALTFTYHSGQYLPDWHPWESVEDYYVSNPETGGCREIVAFELTWLASVFGMPSLAVSLKESSGTISGALIDDIYQILMRFPQGVSGHLLVDVLSRPATRRLRVVGTTGSAEWDAERGEVRVYAEGAEAWTSSSFNALASSEGYSYLSPEGMYVAEMDAFLQAIAGKKAFPNTLHRDADVLAVLNQLEDSSNRLLGVETG